MKTRLRELAGTGRAFGLVLPVEFIHLVKSITIIGGFDRELPAPRKPVILERSRFGPHNAGA